MLKSHNMRNLYWTNVIINAFYKLMISTYLIALHSGSDNPFLTKVLVIKYI